MEAPAFIKWEIGNLAHYQYHLQPSIKRRSFSFRDEAIQACKRLDTIRGSQPIALCYSGGIDSEVIAITLNSLGVPFELFFLDIWGLNRAAFNLWAPPLEKKLGKKINIVELNRSFFYEDYSRKVFEEFGCELPTYLAITYLFEKIPTGYFIVNGDGDLNRSGELFQVIAEKFPRPEKENGIYLPYSIGSIVYYAWSKARQRKGEFYFYSSTPELIAAMISSPLFKYSYPQSSTRETMYEAFPEVSKRDKTTNWDSPAARKENKWIRNWLERHSIKLGNIPNWKKENGTITKVDEIFID